MREWSPRGQRLLARATRESRATVRSSFTAWLARQGIPLTAALVAFQEHLDGLTYHVRGTTGQMHFGLSVDPDIVQDAAGRVYVECGFHDIAPFLFYVAVDGRLAIGDGDYMAPQVIAASGATYIESEAVRDELIDLQPEWYCLLFGEVAPEDRLLEARVPLPLIPEASDGYTTWWGDERTRVIRHVVWGADPAYDRVVGYARTREEAEQLVAWLGDSAGRKAPIISIWPYAV